MVKLRGWLLLLVTALMSTALTHVARADFGPTADESDNLLSAQEQAAGWQLLFDGTSMDSWRSYKQTSAHSLWQAEDGVMVLKQRGGGDLITQQSWSEFELLLDWQIARGGNSGVFFLADESELPIYVHAPEVQLLDDARHPDRKKANHRSGSLYDMIAAPKQSQRPAQVWNTLRIQLLNKRLQVWQNDVQTVDISIGGERWQALLAASKFADWDGFAKNQSGHIGLQDHGDQVAFKNLKIRNLAE